MKLVRVAVAKNIRTATVKTSNINGSQGFAKSQNMHNSAFRYKLDTNGKTCKVLKYKEKTHVLNKF